jgi:hypothetical protein
MIKTSSNESIIRSRPGEDIILKTIREGYNLPDAYFEVKVDRATTRKAVATVLNLQQLTGKRFKDFYVETDFVREANTISSLEQLLNDPLTPYLKVLFSGFMGSGKTTELIKLCFQMQNQFNIIIFSAWNRLKIDQITLESFVFEIIGDVLNYLYSNHLVDESDAVLKEIVDNINDWCFNARIIKEKKKERTRSLAVGINALKGIFFKARTERRSGDTEKVEASRIEERKISDLIVECNRIFDYLKANTGKDTLIIVDDLEKMSFNKARDFFISNSSFIRDFYCKMVLTIPVELIFHADFFIIQNVFGEAEVLPMIKIKDKEGNPFTPGLQAMTEILSRRSALSLFQDRCYEEAVKYSGGAIRELFRIVHRAALIETSDIITAASMEKSIKYHKDIFASKIQERKDEIEIKFQEYLEVLFDIYDGNKTAPQKNFALLDLLRTRAVMKYNGDGFYDTHPLLDTFIQSYKQNYMKHGK